MIPVELLILLSVSFFGALLCTPFVLKLCREFEWMDEPNARKIHDHPTALMGGLSVACGLFLSLLIFFLFWAQLIFLRDFLSLLAGSTLILFTGIYDDLVGLPPKPKLAAQIVAALIPITLCFSDLLPYSWFSSPHALIVNAYVVLTGIFWIVGATNAVNLSDGLDGLASGLTAISAGVIALFALHSGAHQAWIASSALGLAAVGFLPYNLHQARIFLGDTGSLFMGYLLATVSIMALSSYSLLFVLVLSPLIVGVPVFDTLTAIVRRVIDDKPILDSDKNHIHHQLIDDGFGYHRSVHFLWALQAFSGAAALSLAGLPWVYPVTALSFFTVLFLFPLFLREFAFKQQIPSVLPVMTALLESAAGSGEPELQDLVRAGHPIRPGAWPPRAESGTEANGKPEIIYIEDEFEYEQMQQLVAS